eukprot:1147895-Pelagomonas_calceolata.AAC.2
MQFLTLPAYHTNQRPVLSASQEHLGHGRAHQVEEWQHRDQIQEEATMPYIDPRDEAAICTESTRAQRRFLKAALHHLIALPHFLNVLKEKQQVPALIECIGPVLANPTFMLQAQHMLHGLPLFMPACTTKSTGGEGSCASQMHSCTHVKKM